MSEPEFVQFEGEPFFIEKLEYMNHFNRPDIYIVQSESKTGIIMEGQYYDIYDTYAGPQAKRFDDLTDPESWSRTSKEEFEDPEIKEENEPVGTTVY